MEKSLYFLLSVLCCGLNACAVSDITTQATAPELKVSSDEVQPYIEGYADLVHKTYKGTREDAEAMQAAIATFLAQPNATTLNTAREAWVKARQSYLQTEAFRFYEGPIDFVNPNTGEERPEGLSWIVFTISFLCSKTLRLRSVPNYIPVTLLMPIATLMIRA